MRPIISGPTSTAALDQPDPQQRRQPDMDLSRTHDRALRLSDRLFLNVEHGIYVVLGLVLSLTAVLGLVLAVETLYIGMVNWSASDALLIIIGRLLFVLMLAEILHTVRVSISSGTLNCEPFLIVGLIASIRRVLVITLESSQTAAGGAAGADHQAVFQASMVELGVLGGLILVMVISIYLLRRGGRPPAGSGGHI